MLKCTVRIEYDPVTDDYILPLTDEIIEVLDLKEGDTLRWIDNNDGSWTIRKKEDNV